MTSIQKRLFELRDESYQSFMARLLPTLQPEFVIGVRTPALRKFAKELYGSLKASEFLNNLPHRYFEENQLHSFLISQIKDYEECLRQVECFLPYIDNWATCDQLRPKVFKKQLSSSGKEGGNRPLILDKAKEWIGSDEPYTIRFGINMAMTHGLRNSFDPSFPDLIAQVKLDEYYVKMVVAWYFATGLTFNYEDFLPYIEKRILPQWTHEKTIQKARESRAIPQDRKEYLMTLK